MNISYNWLKDLIDIDLTAEEAAKALTRVGLAVEGIEPHGDDLVFDIDLTSNRPDCLSHLGVARELGAITNTPLKAGLSGVSDEDVDPDAIPFPSVLAPEVIRIEAPDLCNRFTARIIKNVKIGPSPEWLVQRLEVIGERSINNVADITNYVMHELGHPMHAFDLDKLSGQRIVVRKARFGETLRTLDEVDRKLDDTMLAICDADKPVSVAGVMGGIDSGITDATVNVLLEVAYFDRDSIRRTSRKLNLASEASYRFERGVDIQNIKSASDRATELICELAGGEAGDLLDMYPVAAKPEHIASDNISAAVKRLTGLNVPADDCLRILDSLGIRNENDGKTFVSPSWRHDIAIEEDLVEEIARHSGYENIADELPAAYGAGEYQPDEPRKMSLRQTLSEQGFDEALSYSFIDTNFDGVYETVPGLVNDHADERFVTLSDSVIEGSVRMRPTLLPGLLDAVRTNLNHNRRDILLYELGKTFAARSENTDGLPEERELFSVVLTGGERNEARALPVRQFDFYDAKGAVESAFQAINAAVPEFLPAEITHLQNGQSAAIISGGRKVGTIGRLNLEIAANYKFKQPVYVAEVDIQAVLAEPAPPVLYTALPKYPSVVRDISFLVKSAEVTFAAIRNVILDQECDICEKVDFVAIYEGKEMAEGERSLTVRIEYRDPERTLTEDEVAVQHKEILVNIEKTLGITPRA